MVGEISGEIKEIELEEGGESGKKEEIQQEDQKRDGIEKNFQNTKTTQSTEISQNKEAHLDKAGKLTFRNKIISFLKNKWNLAFLVVLFLGLLIRFKYIGQASMWNDAAVHLWFVIKAAKDPLFVFGTDYITGDYFVPQSFMLVFYFFTKNAFLAGKIVAMLYGVAGIVFMYLLGSELKNKFTGVIAAAIFSFNHIFWFYSIRPLGDAPVVVATVVLLYCMVKLDKTEKLGWGIASGAMFLVAALTKKQSALFIFALIIYYLLFKRKEMFKNKAYLVSWIIPVGFFLFAHYVGKLIFGQGVGGIFKLMPKLLGIPFGLEALGMLKWIFSWYLIPFVILGVLLVILYKNKRYYFGLILFIIYWAYFEMFVDHTQDRYMLPLLSVAVILAAFSLEEIGTFISMFTHKSLKYILVIAVTVFICWNFYQIGDPLIYNKSFSYSGHEEAGQWMKENIPEDTPIFAGSYRFVRLFTEREYGGPGDEDRGGTIWNMRSEAGYLRNQSLFEEDVMRLAKESDVYLEIDHIEYTQPSWYYPLSQESFDYFGSLGFYPINVMEGTVLTDSGPQKMPMIFILKKDKEE